MAAQLNIAALNACALTHRDEIRSRLVMRDGRVTSEVQALNRAVRARFDLHVTLGPTGRWSAASDVDHAEGRGVVELVMHLGQVDQARAASFVVRLLPHEAAP